MNKIYIFNYNNSWFNMFKYVGPEGPKADEWLAPFSTRHKALIHWYRKVFVNLFNIKEEHRYVFEKHDAEIEANAQLLEALYKEYGAKNYDIIELEVDVFY